LSSEGSIRSPASGRPRSIRPGDEARSGSLKLARTCWLIAYDPVADADMELELRKRVGRVGPRTD